MTVRTYTARVGRTPERCDICTRPIPAHSLVAMDTDGRLYCDECDPTYHGPPRPLSKEQELARERQRILDRGDTPIPATYDDTGTCTVCGEAGRCPGFHAEPRP